MHKFITFICLLCLWSCKSQPNKTINKKPNLLIVLSDQHSYDMVGAYGNNQIITPNLDKLAKEGTLFNNFYSNQAVCSPFRGMLMSGMHPLKNGVFHNDHPLLPNKTKLLGEILKEQGYQTAYIGKWHLLGGNRKRPIPKGEMRYGFDTLLTDNCHVDFRAGKSYFWNENDEMEYFDKWEVYGQTDQALNYLDNIDKSKPFALIVSYHPPHDWGKFKGEDGKMHYRYDTIDELSKLYNPDSIQFRPGIERTPDRVRMYHGYMSMVTGVDKGFGMLMDKLKSMGESDNTLVMFSADHGDMLESHDAILPKQYPHDYSNHIPFIVKYPGKVKQGLKTNLLMGTLDIMPTTLSLLGISSSQKYDGQDLSESILSNKENTVKYIPIWNYKKREGGINNNWRGVITEEYAFAMGINDSSSLANVLFDRKKDPYQLNNLFNNPEYNSVKKELEKLTYEWMSIYNDDAYGPKDFTRIEPKGGWANNRKYSAYELFAKEKKSDK